MRISDWSSDVCSSDLKRRPVRRQPHGTTRAHRRECRRSARNARPRRYFGAETRPDALFAAAEIGRASWRERVCKYVSISVVAVSLQKQQKDSQATRPCHTKLEQR